MINVKNKRYLKAFGKNLKEIRLGKNLSQQKLGDEADIEKSQVGRIERGEVNTTISTVLALASALEVEPKDLLDFEFTR